MVSIILLTSNNLDLSQLCIKHIRQYAGVPYELIVVDNGLDSETIDYLQSLPNIQLILNHEKVGIARGYNQGAKAANGEYLLFMSCESILTENCLSSMLQCMKSHEKAAIVGPVSNNVSGHQRIDIPYENVNDSLDFARINYQHNAGTSKKVHRLLSHCMLIKRESLVTVGGFDERFGLGTYEDDDLCFRMVNCSYSLYIALDAFVHYIDPLSLPGFDSSSYYQRLKDNKQKAIDKWGFDIANYLLSIKEPITISLCMIVKNEEEVLARCLDSIEDVVDEIVIVDTGSTDRTKEIAHQYTNRVYDFTWIDDFAAARNFAFQQATMDYILWLDADDVVFPEDRKKLLELKSTLDWSVDSVTMIYNLGFDDHGNVTSSLRRSRLVKRSKGFKWIGAVHEFLAVHGRILHSDIAVTHKSQWHDSDRNINIYEKRLAAGEAFSPRDQYYYANELYDHKKYEQAIQWYEKFLNGREGWIEDNLSACSKLIDCYYHLGDLESVEKYIFKSFMYDTPRAEFCCRIGYHLMSNNQFRQAAFWYDLATKLQRPPDNQGFVNHAAWTWLPHIQLCVCYDRLGNYELAYHHNEIAAGYVPDHPSVIQNSKYLKRRLGLD
ncbi:MAG: glycosyltransferase [Syntrophomonadaceae bacterium]|nr:glycosyltransferase [Syntrophomonadaceae bacterium]